MKLFERMGSMISKIADEIRLHGSWEAAQEFNEEQARKWMHTERPKSLIPTSRPVPPPPPRMLKDSIGKTHYLKTLPGPFNAVRTRKKKAEMRFNDRNFKEGDVLVLMEFDPGDRGYTGQTEVKRVTHVLEGGQFGIEPGYVMLSIADLFKNRHY